MPTSVFASLLLASHGFSGVVPQFSLFQRGPVKEMLTFVSRMLMEHLGAGLATVEHGGYLCHCLRQSNTLAVIAVCDSEYPARVAFTMLRRVLDAYTAVRSNVAVHWRLETTQQRSSSCCCCRPWSHLGIQVVAPFSQSSHRLSLTVVVRQMHGAAWMAATEDASLRLPDLPAMLDRYQTPEEVDAILRIKATLADTTEVLVRAAWVRRLSLYT